MDTPTDHTSAAQASAADRAPSVLGVLGRPHVMTTLGAALFARLPLGASALLLLLKVTSSGSNYAAAGAVAAWFGAALGIGQPLWSRIIDRRGQAPVLRWTGPIAGVAYVALGVLPSGAPLVVWFAVAFAAGLCQPPVGAAMRGLWPILLTRDDERHVGFAVDAVAFELVFTVGPLIFIGLIGALAGPSVALVAGGAMVAAGSLALAASRPARSWRADPHAGARSLFGALRSPGTITVLLVYAGLGGCFGSVEVGLAAFGLAHHSTEMVSVLLALWSGGSMLGGLVLARRGAAADPSARLVGMTAALAASNVVLGVIHSPALLGAVLVVTGAWVAPIFATASGLLSVTAAPGTLSESFGLTVTATTIGMTIASPVAGVIIDASSPSTAMACSAVPLAAAALLTFVRRRSLAPPIVPEPR